MGSPRVIGPGGVVHASGPPRLDVWKLEKQKKLCLALFGVWFGLFFGFVVKYHGFSRRLRRYASVARHRQLISPSIVVTVTGFLFRPLEFTSHTV
jgi:hypothetical protein